MARRAAELARMREDAPDLLLLSAGDFYAGRGILDMYRSRFLASMMIMMGYDAAAVGENELSYDLKAAEEDSELGLPIICANLYRDGSRIFPPYIIREAGGSKVGVFALLDEDLAGQGGYDIADPYSEGMNIASQLREQGCDMVVLLAHFRRDRLEPLVRSLEGIDLVLRGHTETGDKVSSDCADTTGGSFTDLGVPVLYAGDKGRAIGRAVMTPVQGGWALTDTALTILPRSAPEDSMVASMLREYHGEEMEMRRQLQVSQFVSRDPVTGRIRDRYLGIGTCARCHDRTAADFMLSGHFRTFKRLTDSGNETNEKCLPCHTTGYGRFSGYSPESDMKGGTGLRGVQCEACHGPGTNHSRDGRYKERARQSCRECHDATKSPHFVFQTFWARVGHKALADSTAASEAHR